MTSDFLAHCVGHPCTVHAVYRCGSACVVKAHWPQPTTVRMLRSIRLPWPRSGPRLISRLLPRSRRQGHCSAQVRRAACSWRRADQVDGGRDDPARQLPHGVPDRWITTSAGCEVEAGWKVQKLALGRALRFNVKAQSQRSAHRRALAPPHSEAAPASTPAALDGHIRSRTQIERWQPPRWSEVPTWNVSLEIRANSYANPYLAHLSEGADFDELMPLTTRCEVPSA